MNENISRAETPAPMTCPACHATYSEAQADKFMETYLHQRGYCKPRKHVTSVARFNQLSDEQKSAEGLRMIKARWGDKIDAVHFQAAEISRIKQQTVQSICNRRAKVNLSTDDQSKVTCKECKAILKAKANGTYVEPIAKASLMEKKTKAATKVVAPTPAAVAVADDEEPF